MWSDFYTFFSIYVRSICMKRLDCKLGIWDFQTFFDNLTLRIMILIIEIRWSGLNEGVEFSNARYWFAIKLKPPILHKEIFSLGLLYK